jgi:hypothetical protein
VRVRLWLRLARFELGLRPSPRLEGGDRAGREEGRGEGTRVHASHAAAVTLGKSHPCTVRSALPLTQRTGCSRKGVLAS